MSEQAASAQPQRLMGRIVRGTLIGGVSLGIIAAASGPAGFAYVSQRFAEGHLHAPNLSLIARAPLVIQLHLLTVLLGLAIGTLQMIGVKGTPMHRAMGWIFVLFMTFTALDALFIKNGPTWSFSPLQLFSLITLIFLPIGILTARRHQIDAHKRAMTGLYFGGLIIAGVLTLIPGRLMWNMFFG